MLDPTTAAEGATIAQQGMVTSVTVPQRDVLLEYAKRYRECERLGKAFTEEVISCFQRSLAQFYWRAIRSLINVKLRSDGGSAIVRAFRAAGVSRSQGSLWDAGGTAANFGKICLLFVRNRIDMNEVKFPPPGDALRWANFRTLEHIRLLISSEFLGLIQQNKKPKFADVKKKRQEACGEGQVGHMSKGIWNCLARPGFLASYFNGSWNQGMSSNVADDVRRIVQEWAVPWVLFRTVLSSPSEGEQP